MSKKVNNIHDNFFKSALADKELAQEFLRYFLPDNIVSLLDLDALEHQDYSYISAELRASFSDIIFRVPLIEGSNKHCQVSVLLEHKSKKDPNTAFQLLHYVASGYLKQIKNKENLAPIIPVVYYHGKQPWEYKSIYDHFEQLPEDIRPFIPEFATHFIDLVRMSDEELGQLRGTFIISSILCQKYSDNPQELYRKLKRINHTFDDKKKNYFKSVFVYIIQTTKIKEHKVIELLNQSSPALKKDIMTTYEEIVARERKIGAEESKVNTVLNGYKDDLPLEVLARITELSIEEVRKIIREHNG